jgi:hypothetical protein
MITLQDILSSLPFLRNISEKEKLEFSKEISLLVKKKSDLLALESEYSKILELSKTLSQDVEILTNRLFPSIYFGTAKHHTTKEPYIIARSMWKKGINDYDQLSAYIGPVSKFKNGIEDEEVKAIALDKMRKKIQKKYPLT